MYQLFATHLNQRGLHYQQRQFGTTASTLFEWAFSDHTKRTTMEFDRQTAGRITLFQKAARQSKIAAGLRPSADGSAVYTSLVAGGG